VALQSEGNASFARSSHPQPVSAAVAWEEDGDHHTGFTRASERPPHASTHEAPQGITSQPSPSTASHQGGVQPPVSKLHQLCFINEGKSAFGAQAPRSPSAEGDTAKQLLPRTSPKQLRSSFLQLADAVSHAPLKRPILIKHYKCCSLAMQSKGGFFPLFFFCPSDREHLFAFTL